MTALGSESPLHAEPESQDTEAPATISYAGVAKNTGFYLLSQIVTWAMSFLTISIIPRRIGETGMGQLAVLGAAFSPVGALLSFGLESYINKEIARDVTQSERLLRAGIGMRIVLHLPGVLFSFYLLHLLHPGPALWWLGFWQILLGFPNAVSGLFRSVQTAWEQAKRVSYLDSVSNLTSLITLPLLWLGPISIILSCFGMDLYLLVTRIRWVRESVRLRPTFDLRLWIIMIRGGWPFVLSGLVGTVQGLLNTFLLRHYTNDAAIGVQAQGLRLLGTCMFFPTALGPALLPAVARIADRNPEEFRLAQQRVLTLTVVLSLPIVAMMMVLAAPLCHLLYGPDRYTMLPLALEGYALALIPVSMVTVVSQFLIAQNRPHVWNWFYMGTVGLFALLAVVLIPYSLHRWHNGVLGAALAIALDEAVIAVTAIALLKIPLLTSAFLARTVRALTATALMTWAMWLTRGLFLLLPVVVGLVVFGFSAWLLGLLTPDEQVRLTAIFRRMTGVLKRVGFRRGG